MKSFFLDSRTSVTFPSTFLRSFRSAEINTFCAGRFGSTPTVSASAKSKEYQLRVLHSGSRTFISPCNMVNSAGCGSQLLSTLSRHSAFWESSDSTASVSDDPNPNPLTRNRFLRWPPDCRTAEVHSGVPGLCHRGTHQGSQLIMIESHL